MIYVASMPSGSLPARLQCVFRERTRPTTGTTPRAGRFQQTVHTWSAVMGFELAYNNTYRCAILGVVLISLPLVSVQ